jgi:hypothetical protein
MMMWEVVSISNSGMMKSPNAEMGLERTAPPGPSKNITGRARLVFSVGVKKGGKKRGDFGAGALKPAQSGGSSGKTGVGDLS